MSAEPEPAQPWPPKPQPFRCYVTFERDTARVRPIGELDLDTAPVLDEQIRECRQRGMRRLVLDLRDLEFIDSTGLHLILRCDAEAQKDGFALELVAGDRAVRRVFEVSGVAAQLPFVDG
jgi:anti-sigma B factor antagonist